MTRPLLPSSRVHPAILDQVGKRHADVVDEVEAAIATNRVVVVGMGMNPFPRAARRALDAAKLGYRYLEYGNYLSQWRRRNALKMWTGWPTLPMVFVDGIFVGGANDLKRLIDSGELARTLAVART